MVEKRRVELKSREVSEEAGPDDQPNGCYGMVYGAS